MHDGHAGTRTRFDASAFAPPQWPGFVAAWRDGLSVYAQTIDADAELWSRCLRSKSLVMPMRALA
jgi:hypothetical protein